MIKKTFVAFLKGILQEIPIKIESNSVFKNFENSGMVIFDLLCLNNDKRFDESACGSFSLLQRMELHNKNKHYNTNANTDESATEYVCN